MKTDLTKTPKWNKTVQVKREREREVCIEMDVTRAVQNSYSSNPYLSLPHRKWQRDHKIKKLWKSTKIIDCILSFFKAGFSILKRSGHTLGRQYLRKDTDGSRVFSSHFILDQFKSQTTHTAPNSCTVFKSCVCYGPNFNDSSVWVIQVLLLPVARSPPLPTLWKDVLPFSYSSSYFWSFSLWKRARLFNKITISTSSKDLRDEKWSLFSSLLSPVNQP